MTMLVGEDLSVLKVGLYTIEKILYNMCRNEIRGISSVGRAPGWQP